ncbi:hypothetical protein HK101_009549 [Irineochytrium annulatum]|nr:hypothetical protein HK101_009549 [Irineochytrium annulatum]
MTAAKPPALPGHKIVGKVNRVGPKVMKFKCKNALAPKGLIQDCSGKREGGLPGLVETFGSAVLDGTDHTFGDYSRAIIVDENYVLNIPASLDLAATAPLLCAGVKFAKAFGARVTVPFRSSGKEADATGCGGEKMLICADKEAFGNQLHFRLSSRHRLCER